MSEFTTPGDLGRERIARAFGWDAGNPDPYALPMEFARQALTYLPMAMPGRASIGARAAPVPEGPWSSPAYMQQWLASRSPATEPAARPPTPSQRMPDGNRGIISRIDDAFPGAMHLAKQGAPYAAGAVGGVGGGLFLSDVLGHGRPWQDAAWHALVWPHDDPSPAWWPQPAPGQQ
jgi:hypothetical protein